MPVGFGLQGNDIKTKGRPLSEMAHLNKSIVQVNTETNCLAHSIIIAIAKLTNESNYNAYMKVRKIYHKVGQLLAKTGISLHNGGGIPEPEHFQDHFRQ